MADPNVKHTSRIVLQYPPDFDGELHINVETKVGNDYNYHTFNFTVAKSKKEGLTAQQVLVQTAKEILERYGNKL